MAEKAREPVKQEEAKPVEAKPEIHEHPKEQEPRRPEHPKEGGPQEIRRPTFRPERKAGKKDNVVFVGKKPTMSYVLAVITQFSDGNNEVFVKARGRSISTAIDVVEVTKKKFLKDVKCEIDTDTEVITDDRNQKINVSTLSARLYK